MIATLPIFCFLLIVFAIHLKAGKYTTLPSWRCSIIKGFVCWGFLVVLNTEILSLFNMLTFIWLLICWVLETIVAACISFYLISKGTPAHLLNLDKLSHFDKLLLGSAAFIALATGLIAIIAPPNTWDSMVYHMARVVHWIQNRNVDFYPTNITRQIQLNPWAEFAIMQFQVLSGGDRLANLVQWASMIGSIIGVSLIAKQLGATKEGQIIATVAAVTVRMGILQASSTQNDYAVSLWIICFIFFATELIIRKGNASAIMAGGSLGLSILTKSTAYLFLTPFIIYYSIYAFRTFPSRMIKPALVIVLMVFVINVGHYMRNISVYRNPVGTFSEVPGFRYRNDTFCVSAFVSNIARNIGLHIGSPSQRVNAISEKIINTLHSGLGIDINDPRTTWPGTSFSIGGPYYHDDAMGSPLHLLLITGCIILVFPTKRGRGLPHLVPYAGALITSFILFCLYLRWNPWHSRLHLPLFILASPLIGVVLSRFLNQILAKLIAVSLILFALPPLFYNVSRPLIGKKNIFNTNRLDQYFTNWPNLEEPYLATARFLKRRNCQRVGIYTSDNSWEYAFWIAMKHGFGKPFRIEHVCVTNASSIKSQMPPFNKFNPRAIVSLRPLDGKELIINGNTYAVKHPSEFIIILMKQ